MVEITAALVKQLRDRTGAGMMDCKKALTETKADFEAAIDWLRAKGLAAAARKAGRATAEGLVAAVTEGRQGVLLEVNSETDFVARNEAFRSYVRAVAALAARAGGGDIEKLGMLPYGNGRLVTDELTQLISIVGENLALRRLATVTVAEGCVAQYVHAAIAPGLGRIGVLVGLTSSVPAEKLFPLGKQIAMHIAAFSPQSISVADLSPAAIERERSVLAEQAGTSGKSEDVVAKMVEGRLKKFYEEVVLLEQSFVVDPTRRVKQVITDAEKELGGKIEVTAFEKFTLGEGVEKQALDFAAEVAAQLRT